MPSEPSGATPLPLVVIVAIGLGDAVGYARYDLTRNEDWSHQRQALLEQLQAAQGLDLVFVHYPEEHYTHWDRVFNRARIDDAEVVWAPRSIHEGTIQPWWSTSRIGEYGISRSIGLADP